MLHCHCGINLAVHVVANQSKYGRQLILEVE